MDTLIMDKAGRVVIPKPLRKKLGLEPGDRLEVAEQGEQITLRAVREEPRLVKEHGFWVISASGEGTITVEDMNKMIEGDRLQREQSLLCNLK